MDRTKVQKIPQKSWIVGRRSSILVLILTFGALFSMFYLVFVTSNARISHDPSIIPTEPKISQLRALEIAEKHLQSKIPTVEDIRLDFVSYNFSKQRYETDVEYANYVNENLAHGWPISQVKERPELLNMGLFFVHSHGAVFSIDSEHNTFEKACEKPSVNCFLPSIAADAAQDHLIYRIILTWQKPSTPPNEALYLVDGETGTVVWNFLDFESNRLPSPDFTSDDRTVSELIRELASPPETTNIDIEYGASDPSTGKGYLPKETRVTIGVDNRVAWTNKDNVPHSIVSDSGYIDRLTRKQFDSGTIAPGSSFEFVFTKPGEYSYHSEPYPWMRGKVITVEAFS